MEKDAPTSKQMLKFTEVLWSFIKCLFYSEWISRIFKTCFWRGIEGFTWSMLSIIRVKSVWIRLLRAWATKYYSPSNKGEFAILPCHCYLTTLNYKIIHIFALYHEILETFYRKAAFAELVWTNSRVFCNF